MSRPMRQSKKTLRELREARGWTQASVAVQVGVQPNIVSRWERGVGAPRFHNLNRLAAVFGVGIDELALRDGEARP